MWQALCIAVWLYLTLLCDRHGTLQFHERGKLNCTPCNFVKDERLQEQKQKFKVLLSLHLWSKNSGAVATTRILCYSLSELWYNPKLSRPVHLTWKSNILILKAASEKFQLHLSNQGFLWKQTIHWCRILPKHWVWSVWEGRVVLSWGHVLLKDRELTQISELTMGQNVSWSLQCSQHHFHYCGKSLKSKNICFEKHIYIWTSVFEKQEYMFSRNKQSIFTVLQLLYDSINIISGSKHTVINYILYFGQQISLCVIYSPPTPPIFLFKFSWK